MADPLEKHRLERELSLRQAPGQRELVDMDAVAIVANARQWRDRIASIRIS